MRETKNMKSQIILDLIMIPVSVFMTFDYYSLIMAGDDSIKRKIVLAIWVLSIIGWTIKLSRDLKKRKNHISSINSA